MVLLTVLDFYHLKLIEQKSQFLNKKQRAVHSYMEGVPNINSRWGYAHTLPIRICAAQRGRDFEAHDLERSIHFRGVFYNGV